jgi:protein gp37
MGVRTIESQFGNLTLRQCRLEGVLFFFKRRGGIYEKQAGCELHGRTYYDLIGQDFHNMTTSERLIAN